jgi:hypothetical protein
MERYRERRSETHRGEEERERNTKIEGEVET